MGQILLAKRMGKTRIIAETGAGQHGVATPRSAPASACPACLHGRRRRRAAEAQRLPHELLGAEVRPVTSGTATLKDAMNEAMRDWVTNVADTYYMIGTAAGPHPYPAMVRDFQAVIGRRPASRSWSRRPPARRRGRLRRRRLQRHRPVPSLPRRRRGRDLRRRSRRATGWTPAARRQPIDRRRPGVLHGNKTYLLQDDDGQIIDAHSISPGLDYPGIGPEHASCTTSAAPST
jgi:tryptophan synthase beta chain